MAAVGDDEIQGAITTLAVVVVVSAPSPAVGAAQLQHARYGLLHSLHECVKVDVQRLSIWQQGQKEGKDVFAVRTCIVVISNMSIVSIDD